MSIILETILSITFGSFLTAGVIILIRILFRNLLSARAKYYLWLLLALRLMLPTLPDSPTSLMNLMPNHPQAQPKIMAVADSTTIPAETEPVFEANIPIAAPEAEFVVETQTNPETGIEVITAYAVPWDTLAVMVWGLGVGITLFVFIILYLRTAQTLRKMPFCSDADTLRVFLTLRNRLGIRRNTRLVLGSGGMSGGLFRPTIVIPPEQHGEDLKPILLHELMHIRSHDLWLMAFYRLLCALNWFNPVVWLCFHRANLDSEAACDQRVLETGLVEKQLYAGVLYREGLMKSTDGLYIRTAFGGGTHAIRDRIRQISRFAGKKRWMVPLVLALTVLVSACTLTDRDSKTSSPSVADNPDLILNETSSTSASTNDVVVAETLAHFSPVEVTEDTLNFLNCHWGMTPEEVFATLGLSPDRYKLTNKGKNYKLEVEHPWEDHPEVTKLEFTFHYIDLNLTLGLDRAEVTYDNTLLTYDELVAERIMQLGDPTSVSEAGTSWENYSDVWLTIGEGNTLWEHLGCTDRGTQEEFLSDFDMEDYMSSLHPPGGHYGWTYQQHVENGLLSDGGLYTEHSDGTQSYMTTITLGSYELPATYWFTPSVLTYGKDIAPILREVYVDIPDVSVGISKWIAGFSDSFTNRLYQSDTNTYKTPVNLASFLTEAQKGAIDQAFYEYQGTSSSPETWALAGCWYDRSAKLWKYNGTGYTLYLDAVNYVE